LDLFLDFSIWIYLWGDVLGLFNLGDVFAPGYFWIFCRKPSSRSCFTFPFLLHKLSVALVIQTVFLSTLLLTSPILLLTSPDPSLSLSLPPTFLPSFICHGPLIFDLPFWRRHHHRDGGGVRSHRHLHDLAVYLLHEYPIDIVEHEL
jgi:hypothetical protein